MKRNLIVFSGAGVSAESGVRTFRDAGGLWEQYRIEDVATPEAWARNPALVIDFYNMRRKQVMEAQPNAAHAIIAELQDEFDVQVITQNIDDLHERAGSRQVLHLHGEIMKVRSSVDQRLVYDVRHWQTTIGDLCERGSQLRPHIVWFGEPVPEMDRASMLAAKADYFIVIGTSLNVYPAAGIVHDVPSEAPKWLIDPAAFKLESIPNLRHVRAVASEGMHQVRRELRSAV